MVRFLGLATLLLVAICLVLGASIALADDAAPRAAASMEHTLS